MKEVRRSLETSPMIFSARKRVDLAASTNKVEEILAMQNKRLEENLR